MQIRDLRVGMKKVNVSAQVVEISEPREVISRFDGSTNRVATATVKDDTGTMKLSLWNEHIDQVSVGDSISIENGYVTEFRGEKQLNVGRYGKLSPAQQ